jgi:hypothetical protein
VVNDIKIRRQIIEHTATAASAICKSGFVVPGENFYVSTEQGIQQIFKVIVDPERHLKFSQDPERAEYFVRVKWFSRP